MKALNTLATILLVVGGLNWGLVGLANFDLVAFIVGLEFGQTNFLSRLVYALVGIAAAYTGVRAIAAAGHHRPREATA
jgi:hypothetical protein